MPGLFRRDILAWWLRPSFLRPWGHPAEVLFAGPFLGEFGWELLCWQGFVRKVSRRYKRTIVYCPGGREALYRDFASAIIPHFFHGTAECDSVKERAIMAEALRAAKALVPPGADHLTPLGFQPLSRQEFVPFGRRQTQAQTDVLIHARGRGFGAHRNWGKDKWEELVRALARAGYRIGCIGMRSATVDVEGPLVDYRDQPLDLTLDLLASTRLALGPSSGPMHMASLCRTPHLVWTDQRRYARGHSSRDKYERLWNPFRTPAIILDKYGFDPEVAQVADQAITYLRGTL